jgi:hypothetical protein
VKRVKLLVLPILVISCLSFAASGFAQTDGKLPTNCEKLGSRTWKGSMEERRFQEAVYWACKMDVSAETVMEWQQASHSADRIERIKIGSVEKQELALIERIGGSMRCFTFSALKDTSDGWREVWEDDREGYCMMKCPRIEMNIFGSRLVLEVPKSSGPDCKDIFAKKVFIWDGTTFQPAADHAVAGKPYLQTGPPLRKLDAHPR